MPEQGRAFDPARSKFWENFGKFLGRNFVALTTTFALAAPAVAQDLTSQVLFLGEQHDNAAHHLRQAELVAELAPRALVYEMLTPEQADSVTPGLIGDAAALEATLGWTDSGWPDFSMYHPIFAAAPYAAVVGAAVPRDRARQVMSDGIVTAFGDQAARFGLDQPLPAEQQEAREALQLAAHCDAMPPEMLPIMVDIQRFRDARLAQAALDALRTHGAPVVVITGNGHARIDWGAPAALALAAPEVTIFALGQGEVSMGAPQGRFDSVEIGPDVDRGDPCEAFR